MDKDLFNLYKEHNDKKFEEIRADFRLVFTKLDSLYAFRWQMGGGVLILGGLVTIAMQVIFHFAK